MVLVGGLAIPIAGVMRMPVFLDEGRGGSLDAHGTWTRPEPRRARRPHRILPLRDSTDRFAHEVTTAIDCGLCDVAFDCLGAWTASLTARLRRPVRWAVSCCHVGPLCSPA